MSGGSFNYLYSEIDNGDPLNSMTLEYMESMIEWLREPEQNQPEAANEIERVYKMLCEMREQIHKTAQNRNFLDLLKAAEWWCSHDTSVEDFQETWKEYEQKKGSL